MKRVRLTLGAGSPRLTAVGAVHRAPLEEHPAPVVEGPVTVRRTVEPVLDLAPGYYIFRFLVRFGAGQFELSALDDETGTALERGVFDSAGGPHRVFSFVVLP